MLIGLGLGPGDPELLTLRAVRLLREADMVYVPGTIAQKLVAPYRDAEVLAFPMTGDENLIRRHIVGNAAKIAEFARDGTVVFGLIGDPNFYSTYSRLEAVMKEQYPSIACRTEPGVSAITAFASVAGFSLSGGVEVSDGSPPSSRIILKVRRPRALAAQLRSEGYNRFILVERMYMENMKVYRDGQLPESSDYFSIMYAGKE